MKMSRRQFNKLSASGLLSVAIPVLEPRFLIENKKIRIGQIGTAHSHAEDKILTLRKLKDVFEVVGVVETNPEKKTAAKKKTAYDELPWLEEEGLLYDSNLDAVAIETDLPELVPTAMRCLEAGVHIHIDKPPGTSLLALQELYSLANSNNLIVQTGYMFRYNPAFQFCLKAVREGWLGDIFEIDGVISKTVKYSRRRQLAQTYGGAMMLLGCHLIDIMIAMLGKPNKIYDYRHQTFASKDSLFDNELAVFDYPNASATIRSALVEVEGQTRRQFVVCGTEGTIEIKPLEPPQLNLALRDNVDAFKSGYQKIVLPEISGRYDDQLRDFAAIIAGHKEVDLSFDHELLVQQTLLKASGL
jgi:predicted dehydrogenase